MLKLIRKITGNKLDLFYKGIVFTALENGAAAGALKGPEAAPSLLPAAERQVRGSVPRPSPENAR